MSRPLLLDGIIIQLVGELLFEGGSTKEERARCRDLYGNALEQFSYAVVLGPTLGSVGALPERKGAFPGQRLIKHDGTTLFKEENVLPKSIGPAEGVLDDEQDRQVIAGELRLLGDTFLPKGGAWIPYILQEAQTVLSDEPVLDSSPQHGATFSFPKKKEIYFADVALQKEISPALVGRLVEVLRNQYPERSDADLPEFVERVLLTHYGISRWYEKSAGAANFQRLPFVTRSAVRNTAIQNVADGAQRDWGVVRSINAVKHRVLAKILDLAFDRSRTGPREVLYDQLFDLRADFADHRSLLADIDYFSLPGNFNAHLISEACDALKRLLEGQPTAPAIHSNQTNMSNVLLTSGFDIPRYPESAYKRFPELDPTDRSQPRMTLIGRSVQVAVGNIQSLTQTNFSKEEITMGDQYSARQAGAMGPNSQAANMTFQQWNQEQGNVDLRQLSKELGQLLAALRSEATTPQHELAIGAVSAAQASANEGNGPKMIGFLKTGGTWVFDVATKIGVVLAASAIKSAIGCLRL